MKITAIVLALAMTTGCAWSHRHPTQTKVYLITAGAVGGAIAGYKTRLTFCHYVYEGAPYYGTTCPAPAEPQRPINSKK